jgi:hypothetical protein
MPGVEIRALPCLLAAAALAALLTAGCSGTGPEPTAPAPGAPLAPPSPTALPATPDPAPPQGPSTGGCQVTATSSGSISSSGAGASTSTINGQTSFSCGGGPTLMIAAIDDAGVTFAAAGGSVTIAPGSTGQAAGYLIGVTRVTGGTAEFEVVPQ